jgi:hypothetical protein
MDYADGTILFKQQWDAMYDEQALLFSWLQDEEEGQITIIKSEDVILSFLESFRCAQQDVYTTFSFNRSDYSLAQYSAKNLLLPDGNTYNITLGIKSDIQDFDYKGSSPPLTGNKFDYGYFTLFVDQEQVANFSKYLSCVNYESELSKQFNDNLENLSDCNKQTDKTLYHLSECVLRNLPVQDRLSLIHCLKQTDLLAKVIRTFTTPEDIVKLKDDLRTNNYWIELVDKGSEVVQALARVSILDFDQNTSTSTTFIWDETENSYFGFQRYIVKENLKIHSQNVVPVSSYGGYYKDVDVIAEFTDPFQVIQVQVNEPSGPYDNAIPNVKQFPIPAFYLCWQVKQQNWEDQMMALRFLMNVFALSTGTSEVAAAKGVMKVWRVSQIVLPITTEVLNFPTIQEKIVQYDGGEEFLALLNRADMLVGVISIGEVGILMPEYSKQIIYAWKRIKNSANKSTGKKIAEELGDKYTKVDNLVNGLDEASEIVEELVTAGDDLVSSIRARLTTLKNPARPILEGEGIPLVNGKFTKELGTNKFDNVITGNYGETSKKYIWTIDDNGINIGLEQTPIGNNSVIKHTNLSPKAYSGGEVWFANTETVHVNAWSGRFGAGANMTKIEWEASIDAWKSLGYKVVIEPYNP